MARRTVCAIPAATSGEQNSPEDHPRARPLDPIDSAGGRAGTCEIFGGTGKQCPVGDLSDEAPRLRWHVRRANGPPERAVLKKCKMLAPIPVKCRVRRKKVATVRAGFESHDATPPSEVRRSDAERARGYEPRRGHDTSRAERAVRDFAPDDASPARRSISALAEKRAVGEAPPQVGARIGASEAG